MGRRKKEPRSAHREKIALAASRLFMEKGIAATSMDEIARAAGYSKATLYVYFENKEEIAGLLVLDSMKKLYSCVASALEEHEDTKTRYSMICWGLASYQEEFPFYFKLALDRINVDFESQDCLPEEEETYRVGEKINEKLKEFLLSGMKKGDVRDDLQIMPTIFYFWGMLSGLIMLAANKEDYIERAVGLSRGEFLADGFEMLYGSIEKQGEMLI